MIKVLRTKLWQAASKDETRPVLTKIHVNHEKKRLEATDGCAAAFVPFIGDLDSRASVIDVEDYKAFYKQTKKKDPISVLDKDVAPLEERGLPPMDDVMPTDPKVLAALDVKRLYELTQTICPIGEWRVILLKDEGTGPVLVVPYGEDQSKGLLMPLLLTDANKEGIEELHKKKEGTE